MRSCLAFFVFLIPSMAWAGNTCTTTATGSNWSSSSHWTCTPSGTAPGNGDVAIISNNTTVDVNTTVGQSGPSIITAAAAYPQPSLSQSAGGGSLPAGAYHANFTNVDSAGKESAIAYESGSFTLTASDTLILTMGALPAGVSSRNVYLTAAGGAAGSETLYATGVTTSTYNMTSASWANGTTTQAAATALPVNNWAIQITGGSLTLATNVRLTVHGDVKQGNEGVTLDCGSEWLWDSSTSSSGTSNAYYDMMGVAYSQPNSVWASSGSCSSNPWTISSNLTGGAPGGFIANANTGYGNEGLNLAYGNISNCGTATAHCFNQTGNSATTLTLSHVLFTNDGQVSITTVPTTTNLDIEECTWNSSLLSPNLYLSDSGTATGTRTFKNNVFDLAPELNDSGTWPSAATGNYFDQGWNTAATPNVAMTGNFVRETGPVLADNGVTDNQAMANNYFLVDYWPTATLTSTATSATASTLVDTKRSWTTNTYQSTSSNGWMVLITSGTGVNQLRSIASNTATALTVSRNWTTNPDSTSTYAIYDGIANIHVLVTSGTSGGITDSGNIFEYSGTLADGLGHCFTTSNIGSNLLTVQNNISLPDGSGLNLVGTITITGQTGSGGSETILHNTGYVSNYGGMQVGDYTSAAGMVAALKNNLFWTQSSVPSSTFGGSKAIDTGHPTSGGVQNIVAPANANYNACWNCQTMGYDDNGYGINLSSAAGGNDVNLSGSTAAGGPNFVDSTRNFIKWCQSLGTTGTLRTTIIANCRASMMSVNNFSGAQSAYTPGALVTYVTAGFAPQNVLLHNTASDGADIGAVTYRALPSAAVPVHSAAIY